jgi:hypothetical protein
MWVFNTYWQVVERGVPKDNTVHSLSHIIQISRYAMMEVRIFKTGRVRRGELLRADSRSAIAGEHTTSEERSA